MIDTASAPKPYVLSKKTFMAGAQCTRRLWWELHEPGATELALGVADRYRMEEGVRVGELARAYVEGGVLVERGGRSLEAILGDTRRAIADGGVRAIYEGAAIADSTLVFPDILERIDGGFVLVEVKSTTSLSEQLHVPDLAIQAHVLRKAGIPIVRCELMHLDRECEYPHLERLFVREDVTDQVEARLATIEAELALMIEAARADAAPPSSSQASIARPPATARSSRDAGRRFQLITSAISMESGASAPPNTWILAGRSSLSFPTT